VWVVAHDEEAVLTVLRECKAADWKVHVVGTGSRHLVRDGGLGPCVLKLGVGFRDLRIEDEDLVIGGAVPVAAALAFAGRAGLAAAPELYRVMGTFGASALADDWDLVDVDLARPHGVRTRPAEKVGSKTKGVVLRGRVRLERIGTAGVEERLRKVLATDPPGAWFSGGRGSVRRTLHRAALDRVRLRDVALPDGAPEMLINLGTGTAADLQLLQKSAIERVKRTRGVTLSSTIRWVGQS
jgi:UDP-N-acetylenolpyruvoylglucosamine reductase